MFLKRSMLKLNVKEKANILNGQFQYRYVLDATQMEEFTTYNTAHFKRYA